MHHTSSRSRQRTHPAPTLCSHPSQPGGRPSPCPCSHCRVHIAGHLFHEPNHCEISLGRPQSVLLTAVRGTSQRRHEPVRPPRVSLDSSLCTGCSPDVSAELTYFRTELLGCREAPAPNGLTSSSSTRTDACICFIYCFLITVHFLKCPLLTTTNK